jgi:hypothetical protein
MFIAVFGRVQHWSLSRPCPIQSTYCIFDMHLNIDLPFMLWSSNCCLPCRFPEYLNAFLISSVYAVCPPSHVYLITLIIFGEWYKFGSSS